MKRLFGVVAATGLAVLLAAPAWADSGPPANSSGSGTVIPVSMTSRTADGNTFIELAFTGSTTGTFAGTFIEMVTEAIHPDGSVTFEGSGIFTGHAGACGSGSYTFQVEGQGTPASLSGRFRSTNEAAATVTIHTVNAFMTTSPTTFDYSGIYTC
jgi:hypothetical protein